MIRIALLRHFPTDWNGEGRLQGQVDRPLTEASRTELPRHSLPEEWRNAEIVASPLSRARDTAEAMAKGRPVRLDARLMEQAWGEWEGRLREELISDPASGYVHVEDWGWERRPPGGESPGDVWRRVAPLLAEISQPTVLVAHRALMRAILARAWGWNYDAPEPFRIRKAHVHPLWLEDGHPAQPEAPVRLIHD